MKRDGVVFRGTREGVLVLLDDKTDYQSLKAALFERLRESPSFFRGHGIILDTGSRSLEPGQLVELEEMMSSNFGVHLEKVVHGPCSGASANPPHRPQGSEKPADGQGDARQTLLIKRTLRSGQRVGYDGNVVILGDANPGSEIVATGDIVVVGALRGVAHAGATGDENAIVASLKLAPTQLRIAGRIARPPEGTGSAPRGPEVARISSDGIVVEAMSWIAGG
ncbi:MAG: septum site-determining protein MinC [Firmicutes bacterium]|nr:septum site-determining protein MinC [Bacillota bacterium]